MTPGIKRIDISTEPGNPSTMWMSESGNVYRTLREAKADKGAAINPNDYETKTSWFKRNWKTCTIALVASLLVAAVTVYCVKYKK